MRKFILVCAAAALPTLALGQPAPTTSTTQEALPEVRIDPMHLCYDEGLPYSEGARHGNLVCASPGRVNGVQQGALIWRPIRPQEADTSAPLPPPAGYPSR
jgi:hypothetical protein